MDRNKWQQDFVWTENHKICNKLELSKAKEKISQQKIETLQKEKSFLLEQMKVVAHSVAHLKGQLEIREK